MYCLEARKQFPAFWRRTMASVARASLIEHLRECAVCDRSFRSFALTAPVVHSETTSDTAASAQRAPLNLVRPQRFAISRVERTERRLPERPWKVAAAAAPIVGCCKKGCYFLMNFNAPEFMQYLLPPLSAGPSSNT